MVVFVSKITGEVCTLQKLLRFNTLFPVNAYTHKRIANLKWIVR